MYSFSVRPRVPEGSHVSKEVGGLGVQAGGNLILREEERRCLSADVAVVEGRRSRLLWGRWSIAFIFLLLFCRIGW
jgi:hypothetical protein